MWSSTPSYVLLQDVNIRKGPTDELTTVLATRDIENYYPSCDTEKCLKAIEQVLGEDECCSESYSQCVIEAVPDAGSVTDIFGAIDIDKVIQEECPFDIEEYKR